MYWKNDLKKGECTEMYWKIEKQALIFLQFIFLPFLLVQLIPICNQTSVCQSVTLTHHAECDFSIHERVGVGGGVWNSVSGVPHVLNSSILLKFVVTGGDPAKVLDLV